MIKYWKQRRFDDLRYLCTCIRWIALDDNNKGKSGGARVCFVDFVFAETVYLITVYPKKAKDNLSKEEHNEIKKVIEALKRLTEEGLIIREGSGRSTFYVRADSK